MRKYLHTSLIILILSSCISPVNIPLGETNEWATFGLLGEGKPPVIFVYGTILEGNAIRYNQNANIEIVDLSTQEKYPLTPRINDTLLYYNTNEFPFGLNVFGNHIYYSSNEFKAEFGKTYKINLDYGEEKGTTQVSLPAPLSFQNVELSENGAGEPVIDMYINSINKQSYFKWDIVITEYAEFLNEVIDVSSGDTITTIINSETAQEYQARNYITREKIEEFNNFFRFNLEERINYNPDALDSYHEINVRLRHYGSEVVNYFESINEQNQAGTFNPFIEPVFIQSNLDGILGMIGTYSYSPNIIFEYRP